MVSPFSSFCTCENWSQFFPPLSLFRYWSLFAESLSDSENIERHTVMILLCCLVPFWELRGMRRSAQLHKRRLLFPPTSYVFPWLHKAPDGFSEFILHFFALVYRQERCPMFELRSLNIPENKLSGSILPTGSLKLNAIGMGLNCWLAQLHSYGPFPCKGFILFNIPHGVASKTLMRSLCAPFDISSIIWGLDKVDKVGGGIIAELKIATPLGGRSPELKGRRVAVLSTEFHFTNSGTWNIFSLIAPQGPT